MKLHLVAKQSAISTQQLKSRKALNVSNDPQTILAAHVAAAAALAVLLNQFCSTPSRVKKMGEKRDLF